MRFTFTHKISSSILPFIWNRLRYLLAKWLQVYRMRWSTLIMCNTFLHRTLVHLFFQREKNYCWFFLKSKNHQLNCFSNVRKYHEIWLVGLLCNCGMLFIDKILIFLFSSIYIPVKLVDFLYLLTLILFYLNLKTTF